MNSAELKQRTENFALRIIKLSRAIPKDDDARRVINGQVIRSGTSVASNYRATCRARSKAEFIAKIGTVEEEADETAFWLELLAESGIAIRQSVIHNNQLRVGYSSAAPWFPPCS